MKDTKGLQKLKNVFPKLAFLAWHSVLSPQWVFLFYDLIITFDSHAPEKVEDILFTLTRLTIYLGIFGAWLSKLLIVQLQHPL